jgi:hypothetical protein
MDNITLEITNDNMLHLSMDATCGAELELGHSFPVFKDDYNVLRNKPQINSITLIGNMLLADLFPEGIIIDGGNAEGAI